MHRLRTLHLFAGAGGGILADLLLGHQPVGAVEIEPYCQQVLSARQKDGILPWFPIFADVKEFDGKLWRGKVDVISGGFPCQDISCAGSGAGLDGERSGLWAEMRRIIGEVRPRYVFVENSPRLAVLGATRVIGDLAAMGYVGRSGVLGSVDVGGDCQGLRLWIVAATTEGGRSEVVCREARQCTSKGKRWSPAYDDSCSRLDRIRALERMVGEPAILGSGDGIPYRVDRLGSIGNAQDPRVAALAWRILGGPQ